MTQLFREKTVRNYEQATEKEIINHEKMCNVTSNQKITVKINTIFVFYTAKNKKIKI